MNIWNKLGFGKPADDADTEPGADGGTEATESVASEPAEAAPVEDLSTSRATIHDSSDDLYWEEFHNAIKGMTAKELNTLNYRLGAGVPDFSDWHEYEEAFSGYQWYRFCEAYHYATGTYFSL